MALQHVDKPQRNRAECALVAWSAAEKYSAGQVVSALFLSMAGEMLSEHPE